MAANPDRVLPDPSRRTPISGWPESERPRERLDALGVQALSNAELLALLIGSGLKGQSAIDTSRSLLQEFGSLRALLSAEKHHVLETPGIGLARYARLMAALELGRRHMRQPLQDVSAFNAPDDTRKFLLAQLRDLPYEVFCCLFLNSRHRLTGFEEVFRGTIDGASVHPREVARLALRHNAAAIIVAHNHPSGAIEPSQADEHVTVRLREALALLDVRLLDHFIVGDGKCFSFAESGLL